MCLWFKEAPVSAINGVIWGSVMGLAAFALYGHAALGVVMTAAIVINLMVAAAIGIAVPAAMHRMGYDPALGSSALLTFTTDSTGFFVLARIRRVASGMLRNPVETLALRPTPFHPSNTDIRRLERSSTH